MQESARDVDPRGNGRSNDSQVIRRRMEIGIVIGEERVDDYEIKPADERQKIRSHPRGKYLVGVTCTERYIFSFSIVEARRVLTLTAAFQNGCMTYVESGDVSIALYYEAKRTRLQNWCVFRCRRTYLVLVEAAKVLLLEIAIGKQHFGAE